MKFFVYAVTLLCLASVVYSDTDCSEKCSENDLKMFGNLANKCSVCKTEANRKPGEKLEDCELRVFFEDEEPFELEVYEKMINKKCFEEEIPESNKGCCETLENNYMSNCYSETKKTYEVDFEKMMEYDYEYEDEDDSKNDEEE